MSDSLLFSMSVNVQLHENVVPYLVSPYESFFFIIDHVKLTVESGNGYPGQGGCFYGHEGKCYVSQYRVVFVSNPEIRTGYKSFSLPFYGIRDWNFHTSLLGRRSWQGHVNPVPGGGLVGIGKFVLHFLSHGFDEFRRHIEPMLTSSRTLYEQFASLSTPSVLLLPGKLYDPLDERRRFAYYAREDPMTLFVINKVDACS